jgi:ferredoxin
LKPVGWVGLPESPVPHVAVECRKPWKCRRLIAAREKSAMPHVVCEPCYECKYTDCVEVCPVSAFREAEKMVYIHPEVCIDCESCVPLCPVNAIFRDEDVPAEWRDYIAENATKAVNLPEITERKEPLGG